MTWSVSAGGHCNPPTIYRALALFLSLSLLNMLTLDWIIFCFWFTIAVNTGYLAISSSMRFLGARFYFTTFGFLFFLKTNLLCDFAGHVRTLLFTCHPPALILAFLSFLHVFFKKKKKKKVDCKEGDVNLPLYSNSKPNWCSQFMRRYYILVWNLSKMCRKEKYMHLVKSYLAIDILL